MPETSPKTASDAAILWQPFQATLSQMLDCFRSKSTQLDGALEDHADDATALAKFDGLLEQIERLRQDFEAETGLSAYPPGLDLSVAANVAGLSSFNAPPDCESVVNRTDQARQSISELLSACFQLPDYTNVQDMTNHLESLRRIRSTIEDLQAQLTFGINYTGALVPRLGEGEVAELIIKAAEWEQGEEDADNVLARCEADISAARRDEAYRNQETQLEGAWLSIQTVYQKMTHFNTQQKILAEVRGQLSEMDVDVPTSSPLHWKTIRGKQTSAKSQLSELWDSVKTDTEAVAMGASWLESALDPRAYAMIPGLASLPMLPKLLDVFVALGSSVAEQYADAQSLGAMADDHKVSADRYILG